MCERWRGTDPRPTVRRGIPLCRSRSSEALACLPSDLDPFGSRHSRTIVSRMRDASRPGGLSYRGAIKISNTLNEMESSRGTGPRATGTTDSVFSAKPREGQALALRSLRMAFFQPKTREGQALALRSLRTAFFQPKTREGQALALRALRMAFFQPKPCEGQALALRASDGFTSPPRGSVSPADGTL